MFTSLLSPLCEEDLVYNHSPGRQLRKHKTWPGDVDKQLPAGHDLEMPSKERGQTVRAILGTWNRGKKGGDSQIWGKNTNKMSLDIKRS